MQRTWTPPLRWVFAAATLFGIFSTLQSYRLTTLNLKTGMDIQEWRLLVLNLVYWYVPAILTPTLFRLANRFRIDGVRWIRALVIHVLCAVGFSAVHCLGMIAIRSVLWEDGGKAQYVSWPLYVQRIFLQNLDWTLMVYAAVVGLSYAVTYYRESQARAVKEAQLETNLAQARLRTLEAELHPHFLFNTLHAISSLVHTNPDGADRMISRLSDLLRLTFDRSGAPRVSLQEELEFLQKYLEIEQTRFHDRLSVQFDIDPDTLDAEVPRLILQPLVENAIKHGVSPKPGAGLVQISSRHRDDTLWIEVSDNGVGLSANARARLRSGVGLSNTRDRLECLYGTAHRLEFSDGVAGLAVRMQIPFRSAPPRPGEAAFQVA
jgi:two-component system, LytTR family, sensor kinase